MKKRILSTLMALCLLLTLLPTVALADDGEETAHKHTVCCAGDKCTDPNHETHEDAVTWKAWDSTASENYKTSLPTDSGNYYLTDNVELSAQWKIGNSRDIKLCLNGKTITVDNTKSDTEYILVEGALTITDCKNNAGKITSKTPSTPGNKVIVVSSENGGGTLNLYGGTITKINAGNASKEDPYTHEDDGDKYNGGGVRNEGTFNMYGGTITENKTRSGGGVYNKGTFTMYGGTISNNEAAGNAGGGVFNEGSDSTFTMYGGTIIGNTAHQTEGNDVHNWGDNTTSATGGSTMNAYGGTVAGTVYNQHGTIATSADYEGTVFGGAVTNGDNTHPSTISGGIFYDTVTNNGTISGGEFYTTVTNKSGSTVDNTNDSIINNSAFVFEDGSHRTNADQFIGYGYVETKTDEGSTYTNNDGTQLAYDHVYDEPTWDGITKGDYPGCKWNGSTNTLTLKDVCINKLYLGADSQGVMGSAFLDKNITVLIDGKVAVHTLCALSGTETDNYTGTLTVCGANGRTKDTLCSENYIEIDEGEFILKDLRAELTMLSVYNSNKPVTLENCDATFNWCVDAELMTDDAILTATDKFRTLQLIDSNMKIIGEEQEELSYCIYLFAESITMDKNSTLTLENAYINNFGRVNGGLDGLKSFLPSGYSIDYVKDTISGSYWRTILDENGDVATSFTLAAHPSTSRPSYDVTVKKTENGTVTLDRESVAQGGSVTITVKPDAGYRLGSLTVTDKNGNAVSVTAKGNGVYSAAVLSGGLTVAATFVPAFVDVPADKYFYDAVNWAVDNGITGGVDETHFAPYAACTRGQLVTFLWRAAGQPAVGGANAFTDVKSASSFYQAILWASENGIVGGYDDGTFRPDAAVSRQQTAAILYRYAKYAKMDVSVGEDTNILSFADAFEVSEYAIPALQWAVGEGVITGSDGSLLPHAACTRAQIVTMLYRLLAK